MAFYSDFAGHYEKIFPYRAGTYDFLDSWLPRKGRILDIGCGTGHYCGALHDSGRSSLGIDLDPGMIQQAERLYPDVDFRILGMEEISLLPHSSFAGVFCIGNVLPHLRSDLLAGFLLDVRKLLVPGGIWIFQTVNFDPILQEQDFVFPEIRLTGEQLAFSRWYEDIRPDHLTFRTSLDSPRGEIFSGTVELYPRYSGDYAAGHRALGFERLGHFADFSGRRYDAGTHSGSVFIWRKG